MMEQQKMLMNLIKRQYNKLVLTLKYKSFNIVYSFMVKLDKNLLTARIIFINLHCTSNT